MKILANQLFNDKSDRVMPWFFNSYPTVLQNESKGMYLSFCQQLIQRRLLPETTSGMP